MYKRSCNSEINHLLPVVFDKEKYPFCVYVVFLCVSCSGGFVGGVFSVHRECSEMIGQASHNVCCGNATGNFLVLYFLFQIIQVLEMAIRFEIPATNHGNDRVLQKITTTMS